MYKAGTDEKQDRGSEIHPSNKSKQLRGETVKRL